MKIIIEGTAEEIKLLIQKEACCEQTSVKNEMKVTDEMVQPLIKAVRDTLDTEF